MIVADGFYEWTGTKGQRQPHRIVVDDGALFAMAGLWETWEHDGEQLRSVTIVTTEANDVVGRLHDRMPVILAPDEEATWLESTDEAALQAVLDPYPDAETGEYELSRAVNNPGNDAPELVEPIGRSQSGLEEFG